MDYGLIGASLAHSFSKEIHERLAGYEYDLIPLREDEFDGFMAARAFKAINVTIPYKQRVIPYCDKLDAKAAAIGAVNTIVNKAGELCGFNTDYDGFLYMLRTNDVTLRGKTVLVLGDGGSAKTVRAVARDEGASCILTASRNPLGESISYQQASARADVQIIVNASPAGMYPNNGDVLVNPAGFSQLEAVFDLVYNPLQTRLLLMAKAKGAVVANGLEMLVAQAKYAAELFLGTSIREDDIAETVLAMKENFTNVVLIGMPGSGKTSLGKRLAAKLKRPFVDTDELVVQQKGISIPEIFRQEGEEAFRMKESAVVAQVGAQTGQVISTGGGAVLRVENVEALRQNSIVLFLNCPVDKLSISDGRPLAKSREDLCRLESERVEIYRSAADAEVAYCEGIDESVERLLKECKRLFVL